MLFSLLLFIFSIWSPLPASKLELNVFRSIYRMSNIRFRPRLLNKRVVSVWNLRIGYLHDNSHSLSCCWMPNETEDPRGSHPHRRIFPSVHWLPRPRLQAVWKHRLEYLKSYKCIVDIISINFYCDLSYLKYFYLSSKQMNVYVNNLFVLFPQ